jgi:Arc/MetJ family transcription regulator
MHQVYRRPTETIRRGWRLAQRDDDVGGRWFDDRQIYIYLSSIYTPEMTKRLVEIDDDVLEAAQVALGTPTIRATVEEALRLASGGRVERLARHLDALAAHQFAERDGAWR